MGTTQITWNVSSSYQDADVDADFNRPLDTIENEVMREQLEYLIDHAGRCLRGCSECQRYLRVRSLLLEIFSEPKPQQVPRPAPTLPIAA